MPHFVHRLTQSRSQLRDAHDELTIGGLTNPGGNSDAQISKRAAPAYRPSHSEWQLVAEREPALGSHLVIPRRGYLPHGIYVGSGKLVHYAGLAHGLRRGPVEEIPLACFTRGRPVWVRSSSPRDLDCREVIRRALSRVGEDCYRLLTNNCEHFCEWCLRGEPRSYQVEALLARLRVLYPIFAQSASVLGRLGMRPTRAATNA